LPRERSPRVRRIGIEKGLRERERKRKKKRKRTEREG